MKRPTHRDIARLAKVSHVTVSLALRKHPKIPRETRERIEKIAKKIGYRPDPALSALMVYRRGAKPSGYQGTLAWINTFPHPEEMHRGGSLLNLLGAQERCAELGYRLEEFRMVDLQTNFRRLSKILSSRSIQGLLFASQEHNHEAQIHMETPGMEWEKFSAVAFSFGLMRMPLHVVTNAQFRSARLAIQRLSALGYRRIGCLGEAAMQARTDFNFLGGYLVGQLAIPPEDRIPPFLVQNWRQFETGKILDAYRQWFREHRPDAILDCIFRDDFALRQLPPERPVGRALIQLPTEPMGMAGIHQNDRLIGRTGVDEVVALIHANQRGIPETPKLILIEGRWIDGPSAPRLAGALPEKGK